MSKRTDRLDKMADKKVVGKSLVAPLKKPDIAKGTVRTGKPVPTTLGGSIGTPNVTKGAYKPSTRPTGLGGLIGTPVATTGTSIKQKVAAVQKKLKK